MSKFLRNILKLIKYLRIISIIVFTNAINDNLFSEVLRIIVLRACLRHALIVLVGRLRRPVLNCSPGRTFGTLKFFWRLRRPTPKLFSEGAFGMPKLFSERPSSNCSLEHGAPCSLDISPLNKAPYHKSVSLSFLQF